MSELGKRKVEHVQIVAEDLLVSKSRKKGVAMKTFFLSCLASVFMVVSAVAEIPTQTWNIQKITL